jgi:hypothetical protein
MRILFRVFQGESGVATSTQRKEDHFFTLADGLMTEGRCCFYKKGDRRKRQLGRKNEDKR